MKQDFFGSRVGTLGNESTVRKRGGSRNLQNRPKYHYICLVT